MKENIKLRNVMVLDPIDTGIFTVLKVFPEHIENLRPLPEGGTEVTIKEVDGTTAAVKVAQSEKEIRDLRRKCLELDGLAQPDSDS